MLLGEGEGRCVFIAIVDLSGLSSPPASASFSDVVVTRSNGSIVNAVLMTLDLCSWNSMP
jgi:hypothetical protein